MHIWSEEEKEYLKQITPGRHYEEIRKLINKRFNLNFTMLQIKAAIGRYKLNTGFTGRFNKGRTPVNKGTKGLTGANITSFKKGHKPHNWVPIGSERITKDGYIQIKVQEGKFQHNWKGKHILIWEEHNGPLPKGHAILFGDGDNRNFDINNLILVSRKQLLKLNQNNLIQKDADLTRTAVIITDLQDKIYQRSKE